MVDHGTGPRIRPLLVPQRDRGEKQQQEQQQQQQQLVVGVVDGQEEEEEEGEGSPYDPLKAG